MHELPVYPACAGYRISVHASLRLTSISIQFADVEKQNSFPLKGRFSLL